MRVSPRPFDGEEEKLNYRDMGNLLTEYSKVKKLTMKIKITTNIRVFILQLEEMNENTCLEEIRESHNMSQDSDNRRKTNVSITNYRQILLKCCK